MKTERPRRRTCRLPGYDYSQPGAYFVTIVTHGRALFLGDVDEGVLKPGALGRIVREEWFRTADLRPEVVLLEDEVVVMPNHLHGVVRIVDPERSDGSARRVGLGTIVGNFKAASTRRARQILGNSRFRLWQRGFYDHVVRNGRELEDIRQYILANPANWLSDPDNPSAECAADFPDWMV